MRSKCNSQSKKTIHATGNPQAAMYRPGLGTKTASPTRTKDVINMEINQIVPTLEERGGGSQLFSSGSFLNQLLYIFLF